MPARPGLPPGTHCVGHVLKVDIAFYEKLSFENERRFVNDFFELSANKNMVPS